MRKLLTTPAIMLVAALFLTGCPPTVGDDVPAADVTMVLSADSGLVKAGVAAPGSKARVVQPSEIARLDATLEQITLERQVPGGSELVTVFNTPTTLNLRELVGLSEVVDTVRVPLGTYTSARLLFSSATLYLSSDPATPITGVSIPDGGALEVRTNFTVETEGRDMFVLDLGGLNLTELDGGGYVLTPDFRLVLAQDNVPSQAVGRIRGIDRGNETFTLSGRRGEITVDMSTAVIFLRGDFNTPTGTAASLRLGDKVFVFGSLSFTGTLNAQAIAILDDDDDDFGDDNGGDDNSNDDGDDDNGDDDGDDDSDDDNGDDDGDDDSDDDNGDDDGDDERETEYRLNTTAAAPGAKGEVEYEVRSDRRKLKFEVEYLFDTREAAFLVDGAEVGRKVLNFGRAELELDNRLGDTVPVVTSNSVLEVRDVDSGTTLLGRNL